MCLVQMYNIITVDVFKIDILVRYSKKYVSLMYVRHQKVIFFNLHNCQMAEIL